MELKFYGNGQIYYRNLPMALMEKKKKRKVSHILVDYYH